MQEQYKRKGDSTAQYAYYGLMLPMNETVSVVVWNVRV